jgi:Methane oxygenase PmoA
MLRFVLAALAVLPLCAQVRITAQGKDKVSIEIDGKPFTDLYAGPQASKPYLHPLRSVSGKAVTRGFPMVPDAPGEPHDHPHHKGLWFAHGDVNGYNFWAGDPEVPLDPKFKGRGTIVLERLGKLSSGKSSGALSATFLWKASTGETLLVETRTMTFYSDPQVRRFDFDATLSPQEEVRFGDTKEGMFAIRAAAGLTKIVNSQNKTGEKNTWGKRADWADLSGTIDGERLGIAVLEYPANPRYPTYWHVREYGLLAANIFGVHDFENNPSADGSLTIRPGQPLRFRYRVIIHSGEPMQAGMPDEFTSWAAAANRPSR